MKIKLTGSLALLAVAGTLLVTHSSVRAETDYRIELLARKSHVFQTYLKSDSVQTESKDGAVVLTGTVAEASRKSLAEHTVESLPGVKSVDNQLKVKGESPPKHSDEWIATKVKTALLFRRTVRATTTDVSVKNGIVTLSGEASNLAQKELTAEYAQDVEGVKEVKNEMTVAKIPSKPIQTSVEMIDDASITAQVKSTLLSHRSTSALKAKIETIGGAVTVSGTARNAAEKNLVTRLVTDINGVNHLINNLTIEASVSKSNSPPRPPLNVRIVNK